MDFTEKELDIIIRALVVTRETAFLTEEEVNTYDSAWNKLLKLKREKLFDKIKERRK